MEKKLSNIITIVQGILLIVMLVFNYISDKKMGIVRHLVFKNDVFTKMNMDNKIMILLCILVIGNRILHTILKKKINFFANTVLIVLVLATALVLQMKNVFNYSYYYLGMAMCVQCMLQTAKIYVNKK